MITVWNPTCLFLSYDFEDSIGILKAHYLNHITSYHIISYHNILYDMKIFISESESYHISYHMHIIFISYHPKTQVTCWHVLPKVSQAAKILSPQANLKPTCRCKPKFGSQNCHDIPPATWSQLQRRKIRQSETRNVDSFTHCESWVFLRWESTSFCV